MNREIIFVLILMLTLSPLGAREVTVSEAIECAEAESITLAIVREQLEQSLRSASVTSSYLPDISLTGTVQATGSAVNASFSPLAANINAGISWNIGTSSMGKNEKAAVARTIAELSYATTTESVRSSAVTAYLSLARSKQTLLQAEKKAESLRSVYENQKEKYENGLDSELSLMEAESTLKKAEYSVSTYQALYDLSLQSFRTITGIEGDITLESFDTIEVLTLPSAEELLSEHRDTITGMKTRDAEVSQSELQLASTKRTVLAPSVDFSAGYSLGASAAYGSAFSAQASDSLVVRVSVSVPVTSYIKGSSGDTELKNAESAVTIAKLSRTQTESDTLSQLSSLIQQLESARNSVELAEDALNLAERTYALKKEAYEAGILSVSDFLTAEESLGDAAITLENERINYTGQLYSLFQLLGISKEELITSYGRNEK